jgi:gas vesicle protein
MGEATDELRGQLAQQRQDLSRDLEAIGDRVSPGRIVDRRRAAVRQGVGRVREAVMGSAESATSTAAHAVSSIEDKASSVASTAADLPDVAREHTQGNPMAAGLIAFGAGLLVASVMPTTRHEQQMAQQVQPALESVASEAGSAAQEVAGELKEKASEAAHELKESAQDHAETVKAEAHDAARGATPTGG